MSLNDLISAILVDGKVDASEAAALRSALYSDGQIDRSEADALISLNNKVSGAQNDPAYDALFVEAISDHLLNDAASPGSIDESEANWLIAAVIGDGNVDGAERTLLSVVKSRASSIPANLSAFLAQHNV